MVNLQKLSKNKPILAIVLSSIVFFIVFVFSFSDFFYNLDRKIQNTYYSVKREVSQSKINDNIIVVEIDDKTLEESDLGRFPFDRKAYIPVINNLNNAGALIIGFDIIFSETTNEESDEAFKTTLEKAGNIIIGSYFNKDGYFNKSIFNDVIEATGFLSPKINSYNHVVYSIVPYLKSIDGEYINHFSVSILKNYYSKIFQKDYNNIEEKIENNKYYLTPNIAIPLTGENKKEILINYSRYDDFKKEKKVVSFLDIYDKDKFEELSRYYDFKDKIVIIGAAATGIKDVFYTPNGIEYGVYTHANLINTVLNRDYLVYFDKIKEFFIIFLLIIVSIYFNLSRRGFVLIFSNVSVFTIFVILLPLFITYYSGIIINFPIEIIISLILSITISNIIKYLIEDKNKSILVKALSQYISKDIANQILTGVGNVKLQGERKNVSIFFSDIAGFTTISEKFDAEKLVEFLREYLGSMSNIIMDERGLIDKYEGDAIMALWGVFGFENSSSFDNCKAALLQQEKLRVLNIGWKDVYGEELKVRMGLHTGEAIVGNIGSEGRKMEFTALGDSVNLASRLEGVNKFYGTYICVSESVVEEVKESFIFRFLDKIKVKGKNKPVKIYELIGFKNKVDDFKLNIIKDFENALDLYFKKDFKKAKDIFKNLADIGDEPSKIFEKRCETLSVKYEAEFSREDWDGVWEMKEK